MATPVRGDVREALLAPDGLCPPFAEPASDRATSSVGRTRETWLALRRCARLPFRAKLLAAALVCLSAPLLAFRDPASPADTAAPVMLGAEGDDQCHALFTDEQSCWRVASSAQNPGAGGLVGWWLDWLENFLICKGEQECHRVQKRVRRKGEVLSDQTCCEIVTLMVDDRWIFYLVMCIVLSVVISLMLLCHFAGVYHKPRRPAYWVNPETSYFRPDKMIRSCFVDKFRNEVDVTVELRDHIQALFDDKTDKGRMGRGRDGSWARGLYDKFEVVRVTRIENGKLWSAYARMRDSIDVDMSSITDQANYERALTAMQSESQRSSTKAEAFRRSLKLDRSKHEVLLFHGCPGIGARNPILDTGDPMYDTPLWTEGPSPLEAVCKLGFDDRVANLNGMLGAGIYFADMVSKADCYAGKYQPMGQPEADASPATIFITRVLLGTPYLADQPLEGLRRPPSCTGHFDTNLRGLSLPEGCTPWVAKGVEFKMCDHHRFDSVITDRNMRPNGRLWNEYVVYNGKQAYPEFRVEYRRVRERLVGS